MTDAQADSWPAASKIRAILFDLDGTLYLQAPLRRRMIRELLVDPIRSGRPWRAARTLLALRAFRHEREALRDLGRPADGMLAVLQFERAAAAAGVDAGWMRETVEDWMLARPLPFLRDCVRPGLQGLLDQLDAEGFRAGVFSDYPVEAKLEAMGLAGRFEPLLDATQPEINAFKPHPRGLERACELWGLRPEEVLYVGDRVDVDAGAAALAGMPCAIVGVEQEAGRSWRAFESLDTLREALTRRS
jgi:FMN phosphatase YigB (HAD superfamily)